MFLSLICSIIYIETYIIGNKYNWKSMTNNLMYVIYTWQMRNNKTHFQMTNMWQMLLYQALRVYAIENSLTHWSPKIEWLAYLPWLSTRRVWTILVQWGKLVFPKCPLDDSRIETEPKRFVFKHTLVMDTNLWAKLQI